MKNKCFKITTPDDCNLNLKMNCTHTHRLTFGRSIQQLAWYCTKTIQHLKNPKLLEKHISFWAFLLRNLPELLAKLFSQFKIIFCGKIAGFMILKRSCNPVLTSALSFWASFFQRLDWLPSFCKTSWSFGMSSKLLRKLRSPIVYCREFCKTSWTFRGLAGENRWS